MKKQQQCAKGDQSKQQQNRLSAERTATTHTTLLQQLIRANVPSGIFIMAVNIFFPPFCLTAAATVPQQHPSARTRLCCHIDFGRLWSPFSSFFSFPFECYAFLHLWHIFSQYCQTICCCYICCALKIVALKNFKGIYPTLSQCCSELQSDVKQGK